MFKITFRPIFASRKERKKLKKREDASLPGSWQAGLSEVFESCNRQLVSLTISASRLYYLTLNNFLANERKLLKGMYDDVHELSRQTKDLRNNSYRVIAKLQGDAVKSGQYYVQVTDAARETGNSVFHIYKPAYEYLDNNHAPFSDVQINELTELNDEVSAFFSIILYTLKNSKYENTDEIRKRKTSVLVLLDSLQHKQLKRIKRQDVSIRNSVLYLNILNETKSLTLFTVNLVKASCNFYRTVSETGQSRNLP